jgi:hypothetical protein
VLRIDHVIIATRDLDAAAARLQTACGLQSLAGGEHKGAGTQNRIVPLGPTYPQYVELLAATDATQPFAHAVWEAAAAGDRPFAWAVRSDSLEKTAARLQLPLLQAERRMPDGTELKWQLAGILESLQSGGFLPFFISAGHDPLQRRARGGVELAHRVQASGIAWVEIGGEDTALRNWLNNEDLPVRVVPGPPGIRSFALATNADPIVIR